MVSIRVLYISSLYENDDFIGFLLVGFLKVATLVNQATRLKCPKNDDIGVHFRFPIQEIFSSLV